MSNYVDQYGRYHEDPVTESNPLPNNNAYAYTATAQLLGLPLDYSKIADCFIQSRAFYSFDRHPGVKFPPTSRDEIQGALILRLMDPKTLQLNKFYYSSLGPPAKSSLFTKLKIYYKLRNEHRREFPKYPEIWEWKYKLPRQDQYFINRINATRNSILQVLWFSISSLLTIRKAHRSSKVILWQKLEFLRQIKRINRFESFLLSKLDKKAIIETYFSKDHPFTKRVQGV
jgi:hypothetical protein